jgi:large subunit ribosomal protein L17
MNKRLSGSKLGRTKSHREALVRNQMRSLFTSGYVVTTTTKAKVLKQTAESFLSKVDGESLDITRKMHSVLGNKDLVKKCIDYLAKGEKKVSIVKVSFRDGDSAEMSKVTLLVLISFLEKRKQYQRKRCQKRKK